MSKEVKIVTHSGGFHADEVFAVATLKLYFADRKVIIKRSREASDWAAADIVVDVGAVYDEANDRFDHHQLGGAGARDNDIPYASFGLVWKKYGAKLCGSEAISEIIEQRLVVPIDAIDNGVEITKPVYDGIYAYTIMDLNHLYRPSWKNADPQAYDQNFSEFLSLAQDILLREINHAKDLLAGRDSVYQIYKDSNDKQILIFPERYPWKDFASALEETIFVVYPKLDGTWAAEAVRPNPRSFENKKNFPTSWGGKREAELAKESGVSDAVFCHRNAYLVVARSKDGAFALAQKALQA